MTAKSITFQLGYGQYWIGEPGTAIDQSLYNGYSGLIQTRAGDNHATIMTGTRFGLIGLTYEQLETAPEVSLDSWDDVVEVSMAFATTKGGLEGHGYQDDPLDSLPMISAAGAGSYRVRVHARGRDHGAEFEENYGDPVEFHLIQTWPAPLAAEVRHKLTDALGARIRARGDCDS